MYSHPFSRAYWREAVSEVRNLRKLTFAALMIAACVVLSYVPSLPLFGENIRITWGFLARALCAWVCGPVLGALFGVGEDILSFFLSGGNGYPFFPGYTLSTVIGVGIYALFLYRAKLTPARVFLSKLLTNVENVLLGALWMAILTGKGYLAAASGSAIKNILMLPVQALLLYALLAALRPVLRRMALIAEEEPAGEQKKERDKA